MKQIARIGIAFVALVVIAAFVPVVSQDDPAPVIHGLFAARWVVIDAKGPGLAELRDGVDSYAPAKITRSEISSFIRIKSLCVGWGLPRHHSVLPHHTTYWPTLISPLRPLRPILPAAAPSVWPSGVAVWPPGVGQFGLLQCS